jgi:hypothetical protein
VRTVEERFSAEQIAAYVAPDEAGIQAEEACVGEALRGFESERFIAGDGIQTHHSAAIGFFGV